MIRFAIMLSHMVIYALLADFDVIIITGLQTSNACRATDYHSSILPALAFSLDMFAKTAMSYGVNEVLLASVLGSVVFSVFAAQPLVIVGVTGRAYFILLLKVTLRRLAGPITVFNYTVYDIITPRGTNFFAFMCWIGLYEYSNSWKTLAKETL